MALKTVRVQLSTESIDRAIVELMDHKIYLMNKADEFCMRLAEEVATNTAYRYYFGAKDGNKDFNVSVNPIGNGWSVTVYGTDVGFLEFGAGGATYHSHPMAGDMPYNVYPGSYSDLHHGMYSRLGYWFYNGKKYTHITPTYGFLKSYMDMASSINRIAKEVFG